MPTTWAGAQAGRGVHEHDGAARPSYGGQREPGQHRRAHEVDVDLLAQLLDRLVGHRAEVDDAGDVQHRVEAVEVGHPDRGRVGEVGDERSGAGEALGELGGARPGAGRQDQVVAAGGELVGDRGADAGAGAGDEMGARVIG